MIFQASFILSLNGLFDFDFTFLSEALLFFILSIFVTNFFLLPISKQIEERNEYINYNVKKMDIVLNIACEKIQESIETIVQEVEELNRQTNLVANYTKNKFEEEIKKIEKENQNLINAAKGNFISESANSFNTLKPKLNELADSFFEEKFNFE